MSETMTVQEHICDWNAKATEVVDFGIDAASVSSGRTPIPPQGVRINSSSQGEVTGRKLNGKVVSTDYLLIRADGVGIINLQAVLTTVDDHRIAIHGSGTLSLEQGSAISQLRENITFHTASAKYSWVNRIQGWATGTLDMSTLKITKKVFAA
jgi:hypothetical protein